jgi:hypothetical protein
MGSFLRKVDNANIHNRCHGAIIMLLRLHNEVLLYQQCTFPLPLGKTLFLATVTVDTGCAWTLCPCGEQSNACFPSREHNLLS